MAFSMALSAWSGSCKRRTMPWRWAPRQYVRPSRSNTMSTQSIRTLIEAIRTGGMVVLVEDNEDDSEGVVVMAADVATESAINFMAREARGLICLGLPETRCNELELPAMVPTAARQRTRFAVSIEAAHGVTTGISA